MVPLMAESLNLSLGKDLKFISGLEGVADPPPHHVTSGTISKILVGKKQLLSGN